MCDCLNTEKQGTVYWTIVRKSVRLECSNHNLTKLLALRFVLMVFNKKLLLHFYVCRMKTSCIAVYVYVMTGSFLFAFLLTISALCVVVLCLAMKMMGRSCNVTTVV